MIKQENASVIFNSRVLPDVNLIWIDAPNIAASAKPGQFVMVHTSEGNERLLPRPFSIYQADKGQIAVMFRVVGEGTKWLSERTSGCPLAVSGPFGNGFSLNRDARNLLLVAGGMGIAPIIFLASDALRRRRKLTLLYGAKTAGELFPRESLSDSINAITATDDGSAGEKGFVTDLIPSHVNKADQVFVCGPLPMYRTLKRRREELLGDKPVQVSLEMRMACGVGVCYGCTIKTSKGLKQVCEDGPVFDLDEIDVDGLVC